MSVIEYFKKQVIYRPRVEAGKLYFEYYSDVSKYGVMWSPSIRHAIKFDLKEAARKAETLGAGSDFTVIVIPRWKSVNIFEFLQELRCRNHNRSRSDIRIDNDSYSMIYRQYFIRLVFFGELLGMPEPTSMHLVKCVFESLWKKRRQIRFADQVAVNRCLYKATSECISIFRQNGLQLSDFKPGINWRNIQKDHQKMHEQQIGLTETVARFYLIIKNLPVEYRTLVQLKIADISDEEIAEQLGITMDQLYEKMNQALIYASDINKSQDDIESMSDAFFPLSPN